MVGEDAAQTPDRLASQTITKFFRGPVHPRLFEIIDATGLRAQHGIGREPAYTQIILTKGFHHREIVMKTTLMATVASSLLFFGTIASASAQNVQVAPGEVQAGPGGVEVDHHPHHLYNQSRNCRVVITHRTNRLGDAVTVRRRICD
jgi:hypothetical protein